MVDFLFFFKSLPQEEGKSERISEKSAVTIWT